jgi:hypothetical protein
VAKEAKQQQTNQPQQVNTAVQASVKAKGVRMEQFLPNSKRITEVDKSVAKYQMERYQQQNNSGPNHLQKQQQMNPQAAQPGNTVQKNQPTPQPTKRMK